MKKTAYLLLSVLCFGLVSCEDYLDTDSASYLSPDIVYNSIAYTDQAILGIYAQLPQDQIYGSRLQFTYGSGSDCDTYGTSNPTDTKNSGLANYNGTSDNTAISKEWDAIYKTIEMASVAIDGIRNSELLKSGTVDEQAEQPEEINIPYVVGESVKVTDGPFNGFSGVIEEVNNDKKRVKVIVKVFGRQTPLELSFMQVEKDN